MFEYLLYLCSVFRNAKVQKLIVLTKLKTQNYEEKHF